MMVARGFASVLRAVSDELQSSKGLGVTRSPATVMRAPLSRWRKPLDYFVSIQADVTRELCWVFPCDVPGP